MPKHTNLTFFTSDGKKHPTLNKAIATAALSSFHEVDGKYTTVLVYAENARGAMQWGGKEAAEKYLQHPDDPIAEIKVKAEAHSWR